MDFIGGKIMGTVVALIVVAVTMLLPFLDKIIEHFYPRAALSDSICETDSMLYETDCTQIHRVIDWMSKQEL